MRNHSRQQQNLVQYSHPKNEKIIVIKKKTINEIEFTIGLIFCGFPENQARQFTSLIGDKPPSYAQITKAFNILRPILKQMAFDCVTAERLKMPEISTVCVDGSWDHRRDGRLLIFDVICIETKKIIDFNIQIRRGPKRQGNTDVSPQALEGLAFTEIIPNLISNLKIKEIVKDGEVQIESIIKSSGWNVFVRQDPNHLLKNFSKHFDSIVSPYNFMFRGICKVILKKLKFVLYSDTITEQKISDIDEIKNFIIKEPFLKFGRAKESHNF